MSMINRNWDYLCVAVLLAVVTCPTLHADDPPAYPSPDPGNTATWTVVHVVDAHTVVIQRDAKEVELALAGVSLPPEQASQTLARNALERMTLGESVVIEPPDAPADKDEPAYVYRQPDGLLVNLELVREGYERATAHLPEKLEPVFERFEHTARRYDKGVWGRPPPIATRTDAPRAEPTAKSRKKESQAASADANEIIVYVTRTGRKYHRKDCPYAQKSGRPMPLSEAKKRYEPCSRCHPPE